MIEDLVDAVARDIAEGIGFGFDQLLKDRLAEREAARRGDGCLDVNQDDCREAARLTVGRIANYLEGAGRIMAADALRAALSEKPA